MKLAVIGVGNAGSRITNQILDFEQSTGRNFCNGNTLLINSTPPEFDAPEHVPEERRLTIGDVYWDADGSDIDGDPDLAAEIAREEKNDIIRAFDLIEFHEIDGILVAAGLGRGTGGGAGAVVIDQLKEICDDPIYAVGVLPSDAEGEQPALTAARTLQSYVAKADNVIAFDNDEWQDADSASVGRLDDSAGEDERDDTTEDDHDVDVESVGSGFENTNVALAERLVTLFAAGEFRNSTVSENRMDPSDIIRTLDTGGISSIGFASSDLKQAGGVRSWVRSMSTRFSWMPDPDWAYETETDDDDAATDAAKINRLVREAAQSKLTLPCEISSADRALVVLTGPSRTLSRKGFEGGRYWLEREADIVEVMAGDEPNEKSSSLTTVILFSNVTDVDRIEEIQQTALDHQESLRTDGAKLGTADSQ
ncbi:MULTISPECIES: tubulin/FtsZ family protein [Haloferax]|uniref:Tubulin-like protein CetZ n=1 Tax=Haloferax marinum TaxID=2666143 RepID=A0A6A8G894_9EURY|nr:MULTISPECIES: tubulin/FtsZ family protein [Haloferax]KAB1198276.1 cell division protein FtsZ [Haloferax sp. CBA1150]MRW97369.1 cell division protein FtsZ [Haloferax marinum]